MRAFIIVACLFVVAISLKRPDIGLTMAAVLALVGAAVFAVRGARS